MEDGGQMTRRNGVSETRRDGEAEKGNKGFFTDSPCLPLSETFLFSLFDKKNDRLIQVKDRYAEPCFNSSNIHSMENFWRR